MTEQNESDRNGQKHYPWNEGMPTWPDVEALLKRWPELTVGDRLSYAAVAEIVGTDPATNRWRTVTAAWRHRLRDQGLVVECEPAAAFYVATAVQIIAGSYKALRHVGRTVKNQRRKLSIARPETEEQVSTIQHQGRVLLVLERETKKQRTNLLPTTVSPPVPRIKPPDNDDAGT